MEGRGAGGGGEKLRGRLQNINYPSLIRIPLPRRILGGRKNGPWGGESRALTKYFTPL